MADSAGNQELVPLAAPQRARKLVGSTFKLYRRYPWLFLVLAACVTVPFELLDLLLRRVERSSHGAAGFGVQLFLISLDVVVLGLISALHIHAAADVREGEVPKIGPVARRGLKALPVVAAAAVVSSIGIYLGFLLFVVPGVILLLRWAVVAQAAATEGAGWSAALRRSRQLTAGHYRHIFAFGILVALIWAVPTSISIAVYHLHNVGSFAIRLVVGIVTSSFTALAGALLFYDLSVRRGTEPLEIRTTAAGLPTSAIAAAPLPLDPSRDPRKYSDEDRPHGWYVDPSSPKRMRYWRTAEPSGWEGKTRTPWKVRQLWPDP
jgi:hypothetical protein